MPTDIWAVGCTLYYFVVGKNPFTSLDMSVLKKKILEDEPVYPDHVNPQIVDLIKQCLIKDPADRITLEEIMTHPWVTSDDRFPLYNEEDMNLPEVTNIDINQAITKIKSVVPLLKSIFKMKRNLNKTRERIKLRNSFVSERFIPNLLGSNNS